MDYELYQDLKEQVNRALVSKTSPKEAIKTLLALIEDLTNIYK